MQHQVIPFDTTKRFSKIVTDYISGADALKPFYAWSPEFASFPAIIEGKSKESIDRKALVTMLRKQYAGINIIDAVANNINAFAKENTFCVVTAHQVNLFTGPLYYLIKTASTIQLCNTLNKQFPNFRFVPVFWQGSEDHDFAEINHAHIFNKTFTWETTQKGATGRFMLKDAEPLVKELLGMLGDGVYAKEMHDIISDAYLHSNTLAEAGRKMLNALFGRYGLIVVNGDDHYAKTVFAKIMEDELLNSSSVSLVNKTIAQFPYEAQAHPRDINLFYLDNHGRNRIIADEKHEMFLVKDTDVTMTREEILYQLREFPERFSPNVILRPVFQQKLLPSVAFIGGGGEIAYWMQLKSVFEYHQVQYPMLLMRDSFMIIDHATNKKIQKLQLNITDLFEDVSGLTGEYVRRNSGIALQLDAEKAVLAKMIEGLKEKAKLIDSSLDSAVMAEGQAMLNSLHKLESKLLKAEKGKMEVQLTQLTGILNKLFPSGGLQERYDNMIPWYLRFGPSLIEELIANSCQPAAAFHILTEEMA